MRNKQLSTSGLWTRTIIWKWKHQDLSLVRLVKNFPSCHLLQGLQLLSCLTSVYSSWEMITMFGYLFLISSFPFFFMKKGFGREKGSLGVGWMCDPWSFAAVSCSSRETWCVCIYVVPCNKRVWTSSLIFFSNYGNNLFHL